jgi:hypothetical protein
MDNIFTDSSSFDEEIKKMSDDTEKSIEFWKKTYSKLGLLTIPIQKGTKIPRSGIRFKNIQHEISYNLKLEDNIAILSGKYSDIIIIDFDRKDKDKNNEIDGVDLLSRLEEKFGKIDCPRVSTPKKGFHLYFRYSDILQKQTAIKWKNYTIRIDWRSNNGYCVAPPSKNEKGKYEWINLINNENLKPMPDWLKNMVDKLIVPIDDEIMHSLTEGKNQFLEDDLELELDKIIPKNNLLRPTETDNEYFYNLLDELPNSYFDTYGNWIEIGMIIYNYFNGNFERTLQVWDYHSQKSPDYNKNEIIAKIKSFSIERDKLVCLPRLEKIVSKFNSNFKFKTRLEKNFENKSETVNEVYFCNYLDIQDHINRDNWTIEDIFDKYIKNCVFFIINGGNSFYVTKNKNNEDRILFEYVKIRDTSNGVWNTEFYLNNPYSIERTELEKKLGELQKIAKNTKNIRNIITLKNKIEKLETEIFDSNFIK